MFNDIEWPEELIHSGGRAVMGRRCRFDGIQERDEFVSVHWREAYSMGGTLFRQTVRAGLVKERIPGTNIEVFSPAGPSVFEAWYFENQELMQLMDIALQFGFAADVSAKNELVRELGEFLPGVSERGAIGLTDVDQYFVLFERVEKSQSLTAAEIDGALAINRRYFPIQESKGEQRDKIRNWKAKGFFTIGCI
jgi:hypothetical protein